MLRKTLIWASGTAAVLLAAITSMRSFGARRTESGEARRLPPAGEFQPTVATSSFVTEAGQCNLHEIQAGQVMENSENPTIQQLARLIIADHGKMSQELKKLMGDPDIDAEFPQDMSERQHEQLVNLQNAERRDQTRLYLSMLTDSHRRSVELFQAYAAGGEDAVLRDWAAKTMSTFRLHQQIVQQISGGAAISEPPQRTHHGSF